MQFQALPPFRSDYCRVIYSLASPLPAAQRVTRNFGVANSTALAVAPVKRQCLCNGLLL